MSRRKLFSTCGLLLAVPTVIPAILILGLIIHYAVNVPVTDQYAMIPWFQSLDHGHIPFAAMWANHNEHRIFFPNVILVILARFTKWNILAEIYLSFLVACITFVGLVAIIRRRITNNKFTVVSLFLTAAVFFSPVQQENWIWGWQLEWFLSVAGIIWAINLIDKLKLQDRLKSIIVPGIIAFIATFSLASGFLAWVGGLIIMLLRRQKKSLIGVWATSFLLSMVLYFYHYKKPQNGLSDTSFLKHIPEFLKYYLAYVGRPISSNSQIAVLVGIYILVIYFVVLAVIFYKAKAKNMSAVIAIGMAGIIAGILTGIGRFGFGMAGALQSRYTAFSELIIVSLIVLTIKIIEDIKFKKVYDRNIAIIVILVFASPAVLYSWRGGISDMRDTSQLYSYIYKCSRAKTPTYSCLYQIYFPSTKVALEELNYIKQKGYGGY